MPNNRAQEWFFESAGRAVDRTLAKGKQKLENAKEAVSRWIESSVAYVWKKAEQGKEIVKKGLNVLGNTYRDVSNTVKTGINNIKEWTVKAIDNGKERATNQLKQLDWALKNLDKAIASWMLKAIKRSAETGTMVLVIGKEKVTYTINSVKKEITNIGNAIKKNAIKGVAFSKEKGMLLLKTGEKAVKVSIAAAVATGLAFYKDGKLMVDRTKLAVKNAVKNVKTVTKTVSNTVDQGITQGKHKAAEYLRNTANRIDPRYLAAER